MTYTETAKELNRIAQKIYNCDNTINLRDKLVFEIMHYAEELKQFIPDANNYTLVKEVKKDSNGNIKGFYFKSVIYRNKAYKKVYEIRFMIR